MHLPPFSRLMEHVLAGLHWETCLFYLDDIIVFSSTWEEHLARLRQVFERLRHAKLKLGGQQMHFRCQGGQLLGSQGLPRKASCLIPRSWQPYGRFLLPRLPRKSALFWVSPVYYWRYVKGFRCYCRPFTCFNQERRGLSLERQNARPPSTGLNTC